jgi:hypothetical protein
MSQLQVILKSSDDITFDVSRDTANLFTTIANLMADIVGAGEKDTAIPLPEVKGSILKLALDYCAAHTKNGGVKPLSEEERQDESKYLQVNPWEQEFFSYVRVLCDASCRTLLTNERFV